MNNSSYVSVHLNLTDMQKKIMSELGNIYPSPRSMDTSDLLDSLVTKYGFGKREWQGSLKGLGKKGYITYGNGHISCCENGLTLLEVAEDYFENYLK